MRSQGGGEAQQDSEVQQSLKTYTLINSIIQALLQDENSDLTVALMRDGIYELLLEAISKPSISWASSAFFIF